MTENDDHGIVELSIPAKAEYIALCRLALTGISRVRPLEAEVLSDLKLAITEACSNSIRHAYDGGAESGSVAVRYELADDRIAVEITDHGVGFDPATEPSEGELDEGGLGIAIIRAVVDELAIESNGNGSRIRFVKYLG